MEAKIYDQKGKEKGTITLSEAVFGQPWNGDLVHQVMVAMQANARTPVAHTKDRGEVSGGGKKPWRQKGTGRARHGSTRSPIWIGGGVTHGPRNEKNYSQKINKKMRTKALYTVLSEKMRSGEILFVDGLELSGKTRDAKDVLGALGGVKGFEKLATKKRNAAYITTPTFDDATERGFRNFGNVAFGTANNISLMDILNNTYMVVVDPKKVLPVLESKAQKPVKAEAKPAKAKAAKK